jgi:hypothetical protein
MWKQFVSLGSIYNLTFDTLQTITYELKNPTITGRNATCNSYLIKEVR